MSEFSLLILCAGFGKRMASLTKNIPKPLLKVKNTTLLANNINFLKILVVIIFLLILIICTKILNYILIKTSKIIQ